MSDVSEDQVAARPSALALLTLGALGVVFGDIGTSPLYAFREAFQVSDAEVTRTAVLGVLSLIFWALVAVVTIKYLIFVMRADNGGEGGILALTALIIQQGSEARSRAVLVAVGLFGTALLYGDGMITPAISVLSAVEGLEVAAPSFGEGPWVLIIASVILILLFANQHRGTETLGAFFGPVMFAWFSILAVLGVVQIVQEPGVLEAVNPVYALRFMSADLRVAFLALGGVFLVVTGSEALYADMGHFGVRPIRIGWFGLVFPGLILNYFGQGALLLSDPAAIENPFYALAPSWGVVPLVALATLATVIASQALISGAYSLTAQAIQLGYLPRLHIDHTSPRHFGQIYVPTINWVLMVAAVALVFSFRTSSNLAAAYGVGVATDMVITTLLLLVVMRDRWQWSIPRAGGLAALFLVVDLVFFGSNIIKVPAGGWFPLAIGVAGFIVMTTWKRGRELMAARIDQRKLPVERFVESIEKSEPRRVPGSGVYLSADPEATPATLLTNLRHHEVIHETIVLVSIDFGDRPRVPQARRHEVEVLGQGFYRVRLHYGFMEEPNVVEALMNIVTSRFGFTGEDATYFVGRENVLATQRPGMALWREHLFAFTHRNASDAARYFGLPHDRVVEVGVQVDI